MLELLLCFAIQQIRLVVEILGRDDMTSVSQKLYHLIAKIHVADISQLRHTTRSMKATGILELLLCFAIQQS